MRCSEYKNVLIKCELRIHVQKTSGCQLDFVKKKVFLKGSIFKKKGF